MNETNFTPAPWLIEHEGNTIWVDSDDREYPICDLVNKDIHEITDEDFANAALIAQAPAMYTQLEKLVNALLLTDTKNRYPVIDETYKILAAARGESHHIKTNECSHNLKS